MNAFKTLIIVFCSIATLVYLILLMCDVGMNGSYYHCTHMTRYRIDYVFPARQISCYLYAPTWPKEESNDF